MAIKTFIMLQNMSVSNKCFSFYLSKNPENITVSTKILRSTTIQFPFSYLIFLCYKNKNGKKANN